jgi:hypothetical protein
MRIKSDKGAIESTVPQSELQNECECCKERTTRSRIETSKLKRGRVIVVDNEVKEVGEGVGGERSMDKSTC